MVMKNKFSFFMTHAILYFRKKRKLNHPSTSLSIFKCSINFSQVEFPKAHFLASMYIKHTYTTLFSRSRREKYTQK